MRHENLHTRATSDLLSFVLFMGAQQQPYIQQLLFSLHSDITKMVAFNTFSKLCLVVAFGLSATVTSTDVAQEQPKKESFLSRFLGKSEGPGPKTKEVPKPVNKETQENTDAEEPPMFTVEWYLLPKPLNRATLRERLPCDLSIAVPEDCDEPILPVVEKRIRKFFSLSEKGQGLRHACSYFRVC